MELNTEGKNIISSWKTLVVPFGIYNHLDVDTKLRSI